MATPRPRYVATLLAAQFSLTLVGCGSAPGTPLAMAEAMRPVPAAIAAAAPSVTSQAHAADPMVTVSSQADGIGEGDEAIEPARPIGPRSRLFDQDYSKDGLARASQADTAGAPGDDPALKQEIAHHYDAQGNPIVTPGGGWNWGAIGLTAAGLLGVPLIGYAIYTGMIGSKDLMFPVRETYAKTPAAYGWSYERFEFSSHDGLKLVAWYVPAAHPTTKGIMVLHGHTVNKDWAFKKFGPMLHQDYNLFLYDSRFHGESEGKYTTLGYYERKDAIFAFGQLRSRGNTSIGVLGESMGGAVAIDSGAEVPDCKAVWADCAFDSLQDAIAPRAIKRNYPLPNYVAFSVIKTASLRAKANLPAADPIRWVDKISPRPLYLVHGQKDIDTTPINSDKLYDKAKQPKTIWRTPEAGHAESWELYPTEYKQRVQQFFGAAL